MNVYDSSSDDKKFFMNVYDSGSDGEKFFMNVYDSGSDGEKTIARLHRGVDSIAGRKKSNTQPTNINEQVIKLRERAIEELNTFKTEYRKKIEELCFNDMPNDRMGQDGLDTTTKYLYSILDKINGTNQEVSIENAINNCNTTDEIQEIQNIISGMTKLLPIMVNEIKEQIQIESMVINYIKNNGGITLERHNTGKVMSDGGVDKAIITTKIKYNNISLEQIQQYRNIIKNWFKGKKILQEIGDNINQNQQGIAPKQKEEHDNEMTMKVVRKKEIKEEVANVMSEEWTSLSNALFGDLGDDARKNLGNLSHNKNRFIADVEEKLANLDKDRLKNIETVSNKLNGLDAAQKLQTVEQQRCIQDIINIATAKKTIFKDFIETKTLILNQQQIRNEHTKEKNYKFLQHILNTKVTPLLTSDNLSDDLLITQLPKILSDFDISVLGELKNNLQEMVKQDEEFKQPIILQKKQENNFIGEKNLKFSITNKILKIGDNVIVAGLTLSNEEEKKGQDDNIGDTYTFNGHSIYIRGGRLIINDVDYNIKDIDIIKTILNNSVQASNFKIKDNHFQVLSIKNKEADDIKYVIFDSNNYQTKKQINIKINREQDYGRGNDCVNIFEKDKEFSKRHFKLSKQGNQLFITHLGSNDECKNITEELKPGELCYIGNEHAILLNNDKQTFNLIKLNTVYVFDKAQIGKGLQIADVIAEWNQMNEHNKATLQDNKIIINKIGELSLNGDIENGFKKKKILFDEKQLNGDAENGVKKEPKKILFDEKQLNGDAENGVKKKKILLNKKPIFIEKNNLLRNDNNEEGMNENNEFPEINNNVLDSEEVVAEDLKLKAHDIADQYIAANQKKLITENKSLQQQIALLEWQIKEQPKETIVEKIVQVPFEVIKYVDKIIEKPIEVIQQVVNNDQLQKVLNEKIALENKNLELNERITALTNRVTNFESSIKTLTAKNTTIETENNRLKEKANQEQQEMKNKQEQLKKEALSILDAFRKQHPNQNNQRNNVAQPQLNNEIEINEEGKIVITLSRDEYKKLFKEKFSNNTKRTWRNWFKNAVSNENKKKRGAEKGYAGDIISKGCCSVDYSKRTLTLNNLDNFKKTLGV